VETDFHGVGSNYCCESGYQHSGCFAPRAGAETKMMMVLERRWVELRPHVGGVETHVCGFETNVEGVETNFDVVQTHSEHAETFRGSSGHLVLFEQAPLVMRQHRMVARHMLMMLK